MKMTHFATRFAESIARNPWRILAAVLVLSILAVWATAQLPVYTSRQALLPQDAPVTKRLNAYLKKFGAAADLVVILEGDNRGQLEAFADELAVKLRVEPEISQATTRIDTGFFLKHAYLLMPQMGLDKLAALAKPPTAGGGDLETLLQKALDWTKNRPSLAGTDIDLHYAETGLDAAAFFLEEWRRWLSAETPPAGLDWNRLLAENGVGIGADGHFASHDGRMLFMFVHPRSASEDFTNLGPFVDRVKQVSAAMAETAKAAGLTPPTVGLTGLPAMEYEEFVNIRKDIGLVICTAAGLIAALILLVVRSLRWAVLIFVPMGLGVLWSLGLALVTVGHLTIITATFIAILFGLGADYGIFTSSRIAEERRAGKRLVEAIGAGIGSSFMAILTAGGASVVIFGALISVDFPGFSELGMIAAKGVVMILISTWLVQPALYVLLPPKLKDLPQAGFSASATAWSKQLGAFPRSLAVTIVVAALGFAVWGGVKGFSIPFDYDLLAMLPKDSQAAYYQRKMLLESDYQAEVVIFTARDMAEARRINSAAGQLKTIARVESLTGLFPDDAEARLRKAVEIGGSYSSAGYGQQLAELAKAGVSNKSLAMAGELLTNATAFLDDAEEQAYSAGHGKLVEKLEKIRGLTIAISKELAADGERGKQRSEGFFRALLSAAEEGLNIVESWRQAVPLTPDRIPQGLGERFFASDGSIAIYAFPAKSVYDPDSLDALIKDVYGVSPEATGFPTTHQEFSKSVVESFTGGTRLALGLGVLWIMAASRSLRNFALAVLPLLIGGGWMLGLMALGGIRYNYANIVGLPMVIALAVDYGVWFSYRWSELKGYKPLQVSFTAGKVILLAAGTELAGLGAITLASYRGVSSLGLSITIGLLCCLTATLLVVPAIGQLWDSKRKT